MLPEWCVGLCGSQIYALTVLHIETGTALLKVVLSKQEAEHHHYSAGSREHWPCRITAQRILKATILGTFCLADIYRGCMRLARSGHTQVLPHSCLVAAQATACLASGGNPL